MERPGGRFGVKKEDLQKETCVDRHTVENLKTVHKLTK